MTIRILIADDHGVMRAGLHALLDSAPDITVLGEADSGESVLRMSGELLPDIVLMDIGMPDFDGIEATRRLRKQYSQMKVLILSVYEDQSLLQEAIRAGASGYVIKRAAGDELIDAVRAVSKGYMYIHPAITRLLINDLAPAIESHPGEFETLTPRELEVMGYIIRGFTNRQIAEALFISVRTVEGHRASLFGKLGLKNRVELVEYAEKHGLKGG
ncbi:MAG: nreC [Chloroflexi bacterium]|jgi:DNA-binding NarL/FixJ family response regulator|nr:nreC [Chloroflexota bacterium]